jgi:Ca-activated chloride channel family protein
MWISEMIHSGRYRVNPRKELRQTGVQALAILMPSAILLGVLTQLLYGLIGTTNFIAPIFQGTMLVSDISGSMTENDPDMDAIKAIQSYIDSAPLDEYLGIIVFNEVPITIREYAPLTTEEERGQLKQYITDVVEYGGGTDIQAALLSAISQIRALENPDWQGLVLLFSDGLSTIQFATLQKASLGNIRDPKSRIPVNTIYFSSSPLGGYQMSTIAQKTGGAYFYMDTSQQQMSLQDIFTYARSMISIEKPHLIQSYFGVARLSGFRIFLQILFFFLWGFFTGASAVLFLNNTRLINHYLFTKAAASVGIAILFAAIMVWGESDMGVTARAVLAAGMGVMYLPTYAWEPIETIG